MKIRAPIVPALLLLLSGAAVAEDNLGRLFFTPAQRADLDRARVAAATNASRPAAVQAQPKAPPPKMVTLNGIVRRSDGETTVWVNNKPLHERFGDAEINAGSIAREGVGINLPASGKQVRLKVGQTVDATSGQVAESYDHRTQPTPSARDAEAVEQEAKAVAADASARADADARRREATRIRRERQRAEPQVLIETDPAAAAPVPGTTTLTITTVPNDPTR